MSWGNSWSSSSWGQSSFGRKNSDDNGDINGQHNGSCIAEYEGWGKQGRMSSYYDASCPGCMRDRSSRSWGSNNSSKGNKLLKASVALVGGAIVMKKSIWD